MEDDLMRIFGSDRMKMMMEKLGIPDDMPIENKLISNSIESAQKKVEGHNFDTRKHLVEYDDVINKHRQVIYKTRQNIIELFAEQSEASEIKSSRDLILEYVHKELEQVVSFHTLTQKSIGDFNPQEIIETLLTIFPITAEEEKTIREYLENNKINNGHGERTSLIDYLGELASAKYDQLSAEINQSITLDDQRWSAMQLIERGIILKSIDSLWVEHLTSMDKLRTGIGLQGYGQRDPLVEYKRQAFDLFNNLMSAIRKQIVYTIYKVSVAKKMAAPDKSQQHKVFTEKKAGYTPFQKEVEDREVENQILPSKPKDETGHKIGRNDPCYCGSGKKYKQCHGK